MWSGFSSELAVWAGFVSLGVVWWHPMPVIYCYALGSHLDEDPASLSRSWWRYRVVWSAGSHNCPSQYLRYLSTWIRADYCALFQPLEVRPFSKSDNKQRVSRLIERVSRTKGRLTSWITLSTSSVLKHFCRSSLLATCPFDTFVKTLWTWSTSSKSVSLYLILAIRKAFWTEYSSVHLITPFHDFVLVACQFESLAAFP